MGLDMYLDRVPRYKSCGIKEIEQVQSYLDWLGRGEKYADYSLKKYCGIEENELPAKDVIDFYSSQNEVRYSEWDDEHKYGHHSITETVCYWHKANQIHRWFVDNVMNGDDDCGYSREVTKGDLEKLLDVCKRVAAGVKMGNGKIVNGYHYVDGVMEPIYEDGKVIVDDNIARKLLPTCSGFFFGSTDYDEYYMSDIYHTIEAVENILKTTDFNTHALYYCASW